MKFKVILNPDKEVVKKIWDALKVSEGYCPCRLEHTEETKCMCREFQEKNTPGECHCGLYVKVPDET